MRVAVLGCGPTGLLAAYAADRFAGADVAIFSKKRKSEMFGAMYLHESIPGIPLADPVTVHYAHVGDTGAYRRKVYGPEYAGPVSAERYVEAHPAWDIRAAYSWLWDVYGYQVKSTEFQRSDQSGIAMLVASSDLVINTMPRYLLCGMPEHKFDSREVWGIGDAPERGIFTPYSLPNNNTVVYNGDPDTAWYRASRIYGYNSLEYPNLRGKKPPIEGISKIVKPIGTNCNCWPQVFHVGRYGKWQKGVLSHEAFNEVLKELMA